LFALVFRPFHAVIATFLTVIATLFTVIVTIVTVNSTFPRCHLDRRERSQPGLKASPAEKDKISRFASK